MEVVLRDEQVQRKASSSGIGRRMVSRSGSRMGSPFSMSNNASVARLALLVTKTIERLAHFAQPLHECSISRRLNGEGGRPPSCSMYQTTAAMSQNLTLHSTHPRNGPPPMTEYVSAVLARRLSRPFTHRFGSIRESARFKKECQVYSSTNETGSIRYPSEHVMSQLSRRSERPLSETMRRDAYSLDFPSRSRTSLPLISGSVVSNSIKGNAEKGQRITVVTRLI